MKKFKDDGIQHNWWVVAVGMYACLIFSGSTFFAFSLFVKPLQAAFEWDRSAIMVAFALSSFSVGLASPISGKIVDQFGPKPVMIMGAIATTAGYVLLSFVSMTWHFYLCHVIVGIGGAAMGPVPASAVVSNHFREKRGLAIGLMSTGIGFGGLVFSPLIGGMVIPSMGWQAGYLGISVIITTLIPLILVVIKPGPLLQSGVSTSHVTERYDRIDGGGFSESINLRQVLLSAPFGMMACAYFLTQFGMVGALQSQVPYLQDIGFPVAAATGALGGVGLMSALGKLFFGWLCDRINPKYAFSMGAFLMAVGAFLLMTIRQGSSPFLVWGYALTIGLGAGSWLPAMAMLVSGNFGMAFYGSIFGAVSMAAFIGSSTGPLFAGLVFDMTQGYQWAFGIYFLMCLLAIPTMMAVKPVVQSGRSKI